MAEQYFNNYLTTVGIGGYTAGAGALNVIASAGVTLSAGDTTRLVVSRIIAGVETVIVILKATAVNSSTQFAVTAEGSDTNALAGDTVSCALTVGAMNQIRSDNVTQTAFGSRASARLAGLAQLYSDAPGIGVDTGSVINPYGPIYPLGDPTLVTFSWRNQGGATVTQRGNTYFMVVPQNGSQQIRGQEIAQPSRPYSITACFLVQSYNVNYMTFGLYFVDNGTGKLVTLQPVTVSAAFNMQAAKQASVTAFSAAYQQTGWWVCDPVWLKIRDDGTNFTFFWSRNGIDFTQFYTSVSRTDYLTTPSHVGWFVDTGGNATFGNAAHLISWVQGV